MKKIVCQKVFAFAAYLCTYKVPYMDLKIEKKFRLSQLSVISTIGGHGF